MSGTPVQGKAPDERDTGHRANLPQTDRRLERPPAEAFETPNRCGAAGSGNTTKLDNIQQVNEEPREIRLLTVSERRCDGHSKRNLNSRDD
jgi:hypothetical protein